MEVSVAILKLFGDVAMVQRIRSESERTKRGIQVAVPDDPKSCSPAMVASARSGPPENCVISTFRFRLAKKPLSAATHHDVNEGSTPTPTRTVSCATALAFENARQKTATTVIA